MNDKNNLSFNVSYKPTNTNVDMLTESFLYKNSIPRNTISSLTNNYTHSDENSMSLFYTRLFKKPVQEFTVETNYYWFKSNTENDFVNTRYPYQSNSVLSTYSRLEDDKNKRNYFSSKLNYVHPLGMNTKIETGYQVYYQQLSYDFRINNQVSDNLFEYAEFRNSVYGGITFNLKKIGAQAMLRVENSHIMADSVTHPNYSCFLPSVNLQYKFSATHNLKFTYNRRINRPGIYDMNPYYKIGQNYDITQGNPDLRPDYRDRFQLTYTWNFGSNYFSPYIYQEYFADRIGRQYTLTTSPITNSLTTITKPYNLLNGYETGGGLNATLWYININARVYKGHFNEYSGSSVMIPAVDYFSYSITNIAYYQLDKKKTATVFALLQYNGVNRNAQSKTYSLPIYGGGMQKQLKNHTFGVFWLLPFAKDVKFNRTETETPVFYSENIVGIDLANFIQFSYSYKFNKGKNVKKLGRKVEVESDSKSQTIGR
jgi:outer membrane receptor protein involved in Fe transport